MTYELRLQSPLVRIFPDHTPSDTEYLNFSVLPGETVSFQAAYKGANPTRETVVFRLRSPLEHYLTVRTIDLIPSAFPAHPEPDSGYQRTTPGLFPDCLTPLADDGRIYLIAGQWRALWIDVELPADQPLGEFPIELSIEDETGNLLCAQSATLQVVGVSLPEQTLIHTEWFHSDCLADYYHIPVDSPRWWEIVEQFMRTAVRRGINMLLTPAFTPPLDTAVGGERTTVQLVEISCQDGRYTFGFDRLKRWIDLCNVCGVRYLEIAHLFSQWGAKAAPKVMATVDGEYKQIFGWNTPAVGGTYAAFLAEYLPALTTRLREWGVAEHTFFHISDEPSMEQLSSYLAAKNSVTPYLQGFQLIDALSDYAFYEKGIIDKPIPANDHIEPFLENHVPNLWTYYCTSQHRLVSNRFFSQPLARCRILGVQLYKFEIEGFLHWGYNFYNTMHSKEHINPFLVTDAGGAFPSGDPFLVYPGENGAPLESIRLMVLFHAMQDLRALRLLESLSDRSFVMSLVEEGLDKPLRFNCYPQDDRYLLCLRERVNAEIARRQQ